jgi:hypothetical protein
MRKCCPSVVMAWKWIGLSCGEYNQGRIEVNDIDERSWIRFSLQTGLSNGHVCHVGIMGVLGLYMGTSGGREFDHWWSGSLPSLPRLWWNIVSPVVLGVQCLCVDSIPRQLHLPL